jgi:hypothetical protein
MQTPQSQAASSDRRVVPQSSDFSGESGPTGGSDLICAAKAAVDNLLARYLDQSLDCEAIESGVERAGPKPQPISREALDLLDDGVTVAWLGCYRREDQQARFSQRVAHAVVIYRL